MKIDSFCIELNCYCQTTANTVAWTMYYLSLNKQLQDKVCEEADQVGELGYDSLRQLQFTKVNYFC